MTETNKGLVVVNGDDFLQMKITPRERAFDSDAGWKINRRNPVSLDYTNPRFGYHGNSVTGTAYWIRLEAVRSESGLQHWLQHLREKVWFDEADFLSVRAKALGI